eukprot:TRINITY_DN168_c0_g2_i1.p1 TRINITY_DN168_c0_g2~~TRINITY_DN168_c0_g2_i1.p1  ORF type:complete len:397 (+),score=129.95 TRINITY_DN168_c0_g2_i1:50-1240(+)
MHRFISLTRGGRSNSILPKRNLSMKSEISPLNRTSFRDFDSNLSKLQSSKMTIGIPYQSIRFYSDPADKIKKKAEEKNKKELAEKSAKEEKKKEEEEKAASPAAPAAASKEKTEVKAKKRFFDDDDDDEFKKKEEVVVEEVIIPFDESSVDYKVEAVALVYRLNLVEVTPDFRLDFDNLENKIREEDKQRQEEYGALRVEMENKLRAKKTKGKGAAAPAKRPVKEAYGDNEDEVVVQEEKIWPAITEADIKDDKSSLYRALNHILYLVSQKEDGSWHLPRSLYSQNDKAHLKNTAIRATAEVGKDLDVHFVGHAPFHFSESLDKQKKKTRTWYYEGIYRYGTPEGKHHWVTKAELKKYIPKEQYDAVAPALLGLSEFFPKEEIDKMLERKQLHSAE